MLGVKRRDEPGAGRVPCPMCRIVVMDWVCGHPVSVRCTAFADDLPRYWSFVREGRYCGELEWEMSEYIGLVGYIVIL